MQRLLSNVLRPKSICDIIGQKQILDDDNGIIKKMIKNNFASSLLFFGPPGTGKTTIALALAHDLNIEYAEFNAAIDKKEKLTKILTNAVDFDRYIIIVDEIHRMNKDKQNILLKYLELDNIFMFATTTENPFFTVNPAIRSRCTILELLPLKTQDIKELITKLTIKYHNELNVDLETINYLAEISNGDLRSAIKKIELLLNLYSNQKIDLNFMKKTFPFAMVSGTVNSDEFHDLKSALQKSVRGSDVNASLHYFSRLLVIGDYETLMRRMLIMAYEDIGMANPAIPARVVQATNAFRVIGMPEGIIPLGLAIVEMATSPKSNSAVLATERAYNDVMTGDVYKMPKYLQDNHYKSAVKINRGINYKYPHDFNGWVDQQYLPDEIKNVQYYKNKSNQYELKVKEIFEKFKQNAIEQNMKIK
ncbi:replication-associated recombination protein A [Spiroplasma endosymbiont of Labia minor]|uniref:replication-associated recombination protein A n=1 Tax=Spiroplasma endosymbiont of Labia minor TaxID=3066305 RepID=UPI0030D08EC6